MITDKDIIKLKETFATKKELHSLEEKVDGIVYEVGDLKVEVTELREKMDSRFDAIDAKIDSKFELLDTKLDRFLGNIDNLQTESNVCTIVQRRHTEQIEDLAAHTGFILPA